jgi:hypothetical protein
MPQQVLFVKGLSVILNLEEKKDKKEGLVEVVV